MNKLTFWETVRCVKGETEYKGEDFPIKDIKFDSRGDMEGSAFIAFKTDKDDGKRYIPVAEKKGASAVIAAEKTDSEIPSIIVKDTFKAYMETAAYYRSKFDIPIVGITGSNGKTTVKDMLFAMLSVKYKTLATDKNLNNELGVPQTLLKLDESYQAAAIETAMNHYGEIKALSRAVRPDIAIITKIGRAHIGNLDGTIKGVLDAKLEILKGLKPYGTLILNGDDEMLSDIKAEGFNVIFCGTENDGRNAIYASNIIERWDEKGSRTEFTAHYNGNEYKCLLPVLGKHNAVNALLAMAAAVKLGVSVEECANALRTYPRSSMRLETSKVCGVRFIKDYYNASPESVKAAVETLSAVGDSGKKVAVLGDMSELGDLSGPIHKEIAEYTKGKADTVYFAGENKDFFKEGRSDAKCFSAKEELNAALAESVRNGEISKGDTVLIKGSNRMRMWEQYEFLDRLLERGSPVPAQTRLLVDVDALKHNYLEIKRYVGDNVTIMPVLKADAYGTGADLLADIYSGCGYFAVADLREAEELHTVMPDARFLVLYQPLGGELEWLVKREYASVAVGEEEFAKNLNKAAEKSGRIMPVHIEIDTGMGRLGTFPYDCEKLFKVISDCGSLCVEGIFTHYSSADMYSKEDLEYTKMQTERFDSAIEKAENIFGEIKYKHACAGAAIFNPEAKLYNMVRPGYILRGYYPCEEMKSKIKLKPAMKFVSKVVQVKEFGAGDTISYGRHFTARRKTLIAAVPVGYSDGLMRGLSNKGAFVIKGQLAPIAGNVTMDYTMVDVTDIFPAVKPYDDVFIFDNVNMTIEKMAELCGTIGYEVLTNIKSKTDRVETFF